MSIVDEKATYCHFFCGLLAMAKMVSGFLNAKVVALYTGPSSLAILGQAQSVVLSLNGIVNASVGAGIARYTAENEDKRAVACTSGWKTNL